jgi:hypothetical protein
MAAVMALSTGIFRASTEFMLITSVLALAVYLTLCGVPAYKDALEYTKTVAFKKAPHKRPDFQQLLPWLAIGAFAWVLMSVPALLHLSGAITDGVLRLLSGATAPLGWILIEFVDLHGNPVTELTEAENFRLLPWVGWLYIGLYSLTLPACWIGYARGLRSVGDTGRR